MATRHSCLPPEYVCAMCLNEEHFHLPETMNSSATAVRQLYCPRFHAQRSRWTAALAVTLCGIGALMFCSSSSSADNTLVLELPPSAAALAARAEERARQASNRIPEATHSTVMASTRSPKSPPARNSRTFYSSRGQTGDSDRVVGRLGQVEQSSVIYRTQSSRAAHLSTVPAGTYLAIQSESGGWFGILMSDGTLGWLRRQNLRMLEYQVVSNGSTTPAAGAPVGGFADGLPAGPSVFFQGDTQVLFREAYRYLGVPYHFGGNGANGIDCSAFVKNVFQSCGYILPRHSSDQTAYGAAVPKDQLMPGDRLYFGNASSRNITHTGIYLGNGYFIHASSNSHGVAVSQLAEALYERMYICARR